MPLPLTRLPEQAREAFRARVSGDPTGAPDWVRDIATVGEGPGWFEPDGVVWRVHGDLSTLVGGVAALLGQGAHPLALVGVQRHSDYLDGPVEAPRRHGALAGGEHVRLGRARRARVRRAYGGMHAVVQGTDDRGRPYSAGDPDLLRWVHLAFTDAFLAAQQARRARPHRALRAALARRLRRRVGRAAREALGATDLPTTQAELGEAIAAYADVLEPVPERPAGVPAGAARAEPAGAGVLPRARRRRRAPAQPGARAAGRGARSRRRASARLRAHPGRSCARCSSRSGRTARRRRRRATGSGRVRGPPGPDAPSADDAEPGPRTGTHGLSVHGRDELQLAHAGEDREVPVACQDGEVEPEGGGCHEAVHERPHRVAGAPRRAVQRSGLLMVGR